MTKQELLASIRDRQRRNERVARYLNDPAALSLRVNQALARTTIMQDIIAERFATSGRSGGEAWNGLAQSTQLQRASQGYGASGPILERSGTLKGGATGGKVTATANGLTLEFKDAAAPRYVGKGRATKLRSVGGEAGKRLSDYVGALDEARPFLHPPTSEELKVIYAERDRMLVVIIKALADGKTIFEAMSEAAQS